MRPWVLALGLCGCGFSARSQPAGSIDGTVPIDAAIEIDSAPLDGTIPPLCLGTSVRVCVDPPAPGLVRTLTTQTIDTSKSTLCAMYATTPAVDACVITGESIVIPAGSTVTATGGRRLILMSGGSITISGTLDAASHGGTPGPAADTGECQTNFVNPQTRGLGGGYGGSFGSAGKAGGKGAFGNSGGTAPSPATVTKLTGGCRGGNGADNILNSGGGDGGHSGGAVMLLAMDTLTIDGVVNASGGGGSGASGGAGGGGGGSGGMIVLDATTVSTPGKCFANGGGGGEGANLGNGRDGNTSGNPDQTGAGGKGGASSGGDGGDSAFGATAGGAGANGSRANVPPGDGGGGGGGGGVGVIKIFGTAQGNTADPKKVSPPAS